MASLALTFILADWRLLLWLNHGLAASPSLYRLGLFLTDEVADVVTIATMLLLWLWPHPRPRPLAQAVPPSAQEYRTTGWWNWARAGVPLPPRLSPYLTRTSSRAQLLVFGGAGMMAYVLARLIAIGVDVPRPFNTYLPIRGAEGAFEGLRLYGSFPSDHAALLGAMPVALWHWRRDLGNAWLILGMVLISVRVAVGFHYPSDMLAGALLGMLCTGLAFRIYTRQGRFYELAQGLARGFESRNSPYHYILYFFLIMIGLEFAMHFKHVLDLIYQVRGEIIYRVGR